MSKSFRQDLTGKRFGRLTVMEYVGKYKNGDSIVRCLCDCGNEILARLPHIKRGSIVSCGCYHKEIVVARNKKHTTATHGQTKTRLHRIWTNMKQRCYNVNHKAYKNYGARDIGVCDEWLNDFIAFRDWSIANGYSDELTIDRKDGDKGYSPDNCRWATVKEQQNNKSANRLITYNGKTHNVAEWVTITGINRNTLVTRLNNGWDIERALTTPEDKGFSHQK